MDDFNNSDLYAIRGSEVRLRRVQKLTELLVASDGQRLRVVLLSFSKSEGVSMRTLSEYWDCITLDGSSKFIQCDDKGCVKIKKNYTVNPKNRKMNWTKYP